MLTCYATLIVIIFLNLQACVRLFTSDTKWLVPTEQESGSPGAKLRKAVNNEYTLLFPTSSVYNEYVYTPLSHFKC